MGAKLGHTVQSLLLANSPSTEIGSFEIRFLCEHDVSKLAVGMQIASKHDKQHAYRSRHFHGLRFSLSGEESKSNGGAY
jgi:hypothetical protein